MSQRWRVVIVGGGFGGLSAAQHLNSDLVDVTLIDRRNHHLFQPLLYQVATGTLSPANIASPLRALFKRQPNLTVLMAEVTGVDLAKHEVCLGRDSADVDSRASDSHDAGAIAGSAVGFDTLILAAG